MPLLVVDSHSEVAMLLSKDSEVADIRLSCCSYGPADTQYQDNDTGPIGGGPGELKPARRDTGRWRV